MNNRSSYDICIVGGGIVGSACAYTLNRQYPGKKILLVEKESTSGRHQTSHNSGVIHSGIYYKPGSYKAKNCTDGYRRLVDFCEKYNVDYEICGKVIVATDESEVSRLETLYERGNQNGLENLKKLNAEELKDFEPHVQGVKGIHVPQTGIIDYKKLAEKYLEVAQAGGVETRFNTRVVGLHPEGKNFVVETNQGSYSTKFLIATAGLYSDRLAKMTQPKLDLRILPFRGEYYEIRPERSYLVKNLIYPVPDPAFPFLGVHLTRMMSGAIEAGPNAVLAFKREGYKKSDFNPRDLMETLAWPGFHQLAKKYWNVGVEEFLRSYSRRRFAKSLQKLVPEITEKDLVPGGAGVRAQASDSSGLVDDFRFAEGENYLHVCNAPSPAATSSLAFAQMITEKYQSQVPRKTPSPSGELTL